MAEGIQLASFNSKYFCHHCSREVSPYHTTELICPDCSSGFLEEVSKDLYEAENLPQNCDEYEYESENDVDSDDLSFIPELSMDSLISQMLMNVAGNSHPVRPEVPLPPSLIETEELPEAEPHVEESGLFREELMNEILRPVGMQGLFSDGDIDSALGRLRYFEDYNVDDEVDALASQLLDEVEVAGPPPLSKDQIKALPTVTLSKEHIEKGLQCTVCMDDFSFKEKAKGLPCSHLYHEKCITPWLEKQSTCPNCRDVIKMQSKFKRSRSCPRTRLSSRNSDNRRFSEATSLSDFFTTSMNPFRFLN